LADNAQACQETVVLASRGASSPSHHCPGNVAFGISTMGHILDRFDRFGGAVSRVRHQKENSG
jgi:hypothetical protein